MALTTSPVPQELIESIIWAHKVVVAAHVLVGVGFRLASSTSTGMFNLWIAGSFLATHNGGPLFCTSCPRRRLTRVHLRLLYMRAGFPSWAGVQDVLGAVYTVTGRCFRSKRLGVSCWTRGYACLQSVGVGHAIRPIAGLRAVSDDGARRLQVMHERNACSRRIHPRDY